jgi:hypothetical protein
MKFLAILKDSYREAVSGWVLQVMLVVSGLLMLFVASLSFRLVSLETALENSFGAINWAARKNPALGGTQFVVENMWASKPDEPWRSDYKFDIVVRAPGPEQLQRAKESGLPVNRREIRMLLREQLFYLDEIKVEDVPPAGDKPSEARYRVTTTGTKTPDRLAWPHEPAALFWVDVPLYTQSLRSQLYLVEKYLVNDIGAWVALLVGVVITAGFVPNMLGKGTLDLYVAKPIGRSRLLIYKYVGGLTFVAVLLAVTVSGVWVILGLRTGVWAPQFLAVVPVLIFYFAILYAVSTAVAVFTRSSLLAILATVIAWATFWGFGKLHDTVVEAERSEAKMQEELGKIGQGGDPDDLPPQLEQAQRVVGWAKWLDRFTHPVLPRTYDLDARGVQIIADGLLTEAELKQRGLDHPLPPWWETVGLSSAFIVVVLGLACWRFSTRDG